jgi:hypothetical protein
LPHALAFLVILGTSLTLWAVAGPPAAAGIPYQGRLEFGGEPYTGAIDVRVQVFADAAGADEVHNETFDDVDVRGGAFSVVIGAGALSDELLRSNELYLALSVGDPLVPLAGLQKLHPAAQAQPTRFTADLVVTPASFELTNGSASIAMNGADIDLLPGPGGVVDVAGWVDQTAPHIRLKTTIYENCGDNIDVNWNTIVEQTGDFTVNSNQGHVVVGTPGVYLITLGLHLIDMSDNEFSNVRLLKNDQLLYISREYGHTQNNVSHHMSAVVPMAAGDYISVGCSIPNTSVSSQSDFNLLTITKLH